MAAITSIHTNLTIAPTLRLTTMCISKKYSFFLIYILLSGCSTKTSYPKGGFDYPTHVADEDSNFYYYQLKNIEPKKDQFQDSYEYLFFKAFDEPNLSIKPQQTETFRLTCGAALGESTIIVVTPNLITIKKGAPAIIYEEDTTRLSAIENFHLRLLKYRYPIDTSGKNVYVKHYLDSLTKAYPELLDPAYYHKLYDKSFVQKFDKYKYFMKKIPLTDTQFMSLIEEVNQSGFWTMPNEIECEDPPTD
ncbi:MAG TPA: hypothetical protein VK588_05185, partial [Chitinophagaceae bacterium]|nr:hypothetical protein [Chitinophagaceae bacterium]